MNYMEEYNRWLESNIVTEQDKDILRNYSDAEIEEFFDSPLNFGTAGIRKKMFLGSGALNKYTIAHITRGVCDFVLSQGKANPSVVIAYDSRHNSKEFAELASRVLAAKGIHVFLYEDIRPTPELSFAVRYSQSAAGINITASHNTKEYNGYKVYGPDGIQLSPEEAAKVAAVIDGNDVLNPPEEMDFDKAVESGTIELINGYFDNIYLARVLQQSLMSEDVREKAKDMKVVYTAFHGTGSVFVPRVLERDGFEKVICEPSQIIPDGDFPTVKSPNPETKESFKLSIELAEKEGADLVIGTDPDGDRCGVAVRGSNGFEVLTGNQVGILLLDYIIKSREAIGGIPERNDYLTAINARDKDAILASMLVAEAACYHTCQGKTLLEALVDAEKTVSELESEINSWGIIN